MGEGKLRIGPMEVSLGSGRVYVGLQRLEHGESGRFMDGLGYVKVLGDTAHPDLWGLWGACAQIVP